MAVTPMIDSSSIENGLTMPSAAMAVPPTPDSRTLPRRDERARQRRAQSVTGFLCSHNKDRNRLHEGWFRRYRLPHQRRFLAHADDENLFAIGRCNDLFRFGDHRTAGGNREAGKAGARDEFDGARTDRRKVKTPILSGLRRLHQHAYARRRGYAAEPTQFEIRVSM